MRQDSGVSDLEGLKPGTIIKARAADGDFKRVEVLEVDIGQPMPVKVRTLGIAKKKKSKEKDAWMKPEDCRLIREVSVDWEDFDRKMPTGQDSESRDKRKEVFADWAARKKSLTVDQLHRGVRDLLGEDFGTDVEEIEYCVKAAWKAARALAPPKKKGKQSAAKTVDQKEFHAFIVALKYYIELAEIFEHLDTHQEDDQRLSLRECRKGLGSLEAWGITEEKLAEKFKGVECWTPHINFEDFARWCVEERWSTMVLTTELDSSDDEVQLADAGAELRGVAGIANEDKRYGQECLNNRKKVMEIFKRADANNSGMISEDELVAVFTELNSRITPEVAKRLFKLADANQDGQVDYEEFCLWLFR